PDDRRGCASGSSRLPPTTPTAPESVRGVRIGRHPPDLRRVASDASFPLCMGFVCPILERGIDLYLSPISSSQSFSVRTVTPSSAALRALEPASAPTTT